jgi:hypothetical protein
MVAEPHAPDDNPSLPTTESLSATSTRWSDAHSQFQHSIEAGSGGN